MVQVLVKVQTFLKSCSDKTKQHQKNLLWITFGVAVLIVVFFFIFVFVLIFPMWQVSQFGINNATLEVTLENQYRATLIQIIATFAQILGGVAILIGLYFAWKNVKIAQDTLSHNQNTSQENLKVAQEGQITERFTRADRVVKVANSYPS